LRKVTIGNIAGLLCSCKKLNFLQQFHGQIMAAQTDDMFYSRLPANEIPLGELLDESHLFYKIPGSWYVLMTDIKNSTQAIAHGMHETVNLLATGSIIAVLNIALRHKLTFPFFFGGDGATLIVPQRILEPAIKSLQVHQQNSRQNFNIEMRVGAMPVNHIYNQGYEMVISKLRTSSLFSIPVLLGDGLAHAERVIKGDNYKLEDKGPGELDLTGMQCRWDKIKPPVNYDEVVSLLVIAGDSVQQAHAFKTVIDKLDEIYGSPDRRKPISIPMLKLKATLEKIGLEMKTRFGRTKPVYVLFNLVKTMVGIFYFKTKKGKRYLQELVALSDTLVIDGKINTVIAGTASQRIQLEKELHRLEQQGMIRYGLFVSKESVMSCYVRSMNEEHIHFVDGADGGYTMSAGILKRKSPGVV
jgi:hypothetical protein